MSVRKVHTTTGSTPPVLDIRTPAGTVTLDAVEGADALDVRVEALDGAAEELLDRVDIETGAADPDAVDSPVRLRVVVPHRLLWRTPSFAITVRTPPDARARVASGAADVEVRGRTGRLELTAASGDTTVDECADLQLRSASGDARIGTVTGRAVLATASGDLSVGSARGGLEVRTASGDVSVRDCAGDVSLTSASGDLTVGAAGSGSLQAKTVSGDVSVGVVPGLRVWLDLSSVSGRMRSGLDDGAGDEDGPPQLSLGLRSVSGDLRVHRAAPAPAARAGSPGE